MPFLLERYGVKLRVKKTDFQQHEVLVPCVVKDNSLSHASKCSSRGHDYTLSLDRIPTTSCYLVMSSANQALPTISYKGRASPNFFHWAWPRYRKKTHRCAGGFLFRTNGDLVQRYRELAEVVIVERALGVGRLLERESLRHFDVEGTGLDQAINFLERRILILPVIRLHGNAGMVFLRQLNTVWIGDPSTATQRG